MKKLKKILCVFGLVLAAGCTNESGSMRALQSSGFTNITLTGYEYFGCGDNDNFHTGFSATNPNGQRVSGVVCCGWTKACTVRF